MHAYKGKSKCTCGKRAKWRVYRTTGNLFACEKHKSKLKGIPEGRDDDFFTEADEQTWMRL